MARFNTPSGIAVDSAKGNVFVADMFNHTIRKMTPSGVVTTFAGFAGFTGSTDGTGFVARFNFPNGLAIDGSGNLYVADQQNSAIRKITPGAVVTMLAGLPGSCGSADGTNAVARFCNPAGVAVGAGGTLYVSDSVGQYDSSGFIRRCCDDDRLDIQRPLAAPMNRE